MVIARKEMREAFRSRTIKYSIIVLGFTFGFAIPLLLSSVGGLISTSTGSNLSNIPLPTDFFPAFTIGQRFYLFLLYLVVSLLLLMVPVILPVYISADSFAGERERKTIQQLLSTPLTDSEILLGKMLTSLIPTLITTYVCILSTTIIVNLSWWRTYGVFQIVFPDLTAFIQLIALYPLLAFFGTLTMVWVSTRVNKVMEATQLGGIVVVPVIIIALVGIIFGGLISIDFELSITGVFALVDYGLFKMASKRFTREAILKRL
jgi:ABC-type transport system involved in multi-copper enzyme maturation permease subunit